MSQQEREYYSTVAFEMFQKHGSEEGLRRIQSSIEQSRFYGTIQEKKTMYHRWSNIKYEFQKLIKDEETNNNPQTS